MQQRFGGQPGPYSFEQFGDHRPPAQFGTDLAGAYAARTGLGELPKIFPVARYPEDNFGVATRAGCGGLGATFQLSGQMLPQERLESSAPRVVRARPPACSSH